MTWNHGRLDDRLRRRIVAQAERALERGDDGTGDYVELDRNEVSVNVELIRGPIPPLELLARRRDAIRRRRRRQRIRTVALWAAITLLWAAAIGVGMAGGLPGLLR